MLKRERYLSYLEKRGYTPTAQHAKLCCLHTGIGFLRLRGGTEEILKELEIIKSWASTLGKEAKAQKRVQLEDMGEGSGHLSAIQAFMENDQVRARSLTSSARKGKPLKPNSIRSVTIWLAGVLLNGNHQRPGAISNARIEEFKSSRVVEEGRQRYTVILVNDHKSATTGRVKITIPPSVNSLLRDYVAYIRPHMAESVYLFRMPTPKVALWITFQGMYSPLPRV